MALFAQRAETSAVPYRRSGVGRLAPAVVTLGFGLHVVAWVVAGAACLQAARPYGLGVAGPTLVLAVSIVVGAAVSIPAGALTDRHGARAVLPILATVTAFSIALTTAASTTPVLVGAVVALCVAGSVFPASAALLARNGPTRRRGLRLSMFSVGVGGAALAAVLLRPAVPGLTSHRLAWVVSGLLAAYAVLAATVLRDTPTAVRKTSILRDAAIVVRIPAVRQWCILYAVAAGPLVAALYCLVTGLTPTGYRPWGDATVLTATLIAVAAAARPVGGRLAAVRDPAPRLAACYSVAAGLGVLVALQPPRQVTVVALVLITAALGAAGGGVLYRIGRAAPPERTGLVVGVIGAATVAAGLLSPVLIWAGHEIQGQPTIGIMLLAGVAFAVAGHLRRRQDWVNPLAYPLLHSGPIALESPQFPSSGTSIVALTADDTDRDPASVLSILTELATRHELIVVYRSTTASLTPLQLIAAIRDRLPKHQIAGVIVDVTSLAESMEWTVLNDLMADGAVAVAVIDADDLASAARTVARRVRADAIHQLTVGPGGGVGLQRLPSASADTSTRPLRMLL